MDDHTPVPPRPGDVVPLAPGVRRILAPNPSPMTYHGTNSYLIGDKELAVIDPGPDDPAHLGALLAAISDLGRLVAILVTHAHRDHSPLARALSQETGAAVMAFGDATSGRSAAMARLATDGIGGGEGLDHDFEPDRRLEDGARIPLDGSEVEALWTPGHMGNHLCFAWRGRLFSGDLVMGWASTVISPPDGDLAAFYASCARLRERGFGCAFPGHGDPIDDLRARIDWLVAHRQQRSAQILAALADGPSDVPALTARLYDDVDPRLLPAAARNVFAHLIALDAEGAVTATPRLTETARFMLAP